MPKKTSLTALAAVSGATLLSLTTLPAAHAATTAQPHVKAAATTSSVSFVLSQTASQTTGLTALSRLAHPNRARFRALEPAAIHRASITAWAHQHGLSVVHTGPFVVQVSGPAKTLATLLDTTVTSSTVHGAAYLHAVRTPSVPAALRPVVSGLVGLDNRPKYRHADTSYSGVDLQAMHGLSTSYDTTAGAGTTVGTLNLAGWYSSDIQTYADHYGLTAPSITEVIDGGGKSVAPADPNDDDGSSVEVALDAESIFATAPAAKQIQYFGGNTDADYLSILDSMASDAAAGKLQTASSSWGLCEKDQTSKAVMQQDSDEIEKIVAAGATFFASSGDAGGYDCSAGDDNADVDNTVAVDFPASSPWTVAVGGTNVQEPTAGTYTHTAWGTDRFSYEASSYKGDGSGGGYSTYFAKPSWQVNGLSSTFRTVPDIATIADPATGFETYDTYDGEFEPIGGTSLASPVSAASLAVVEGHNKVYGLGNILPTLYANGATSGDFTDVLTGNNHVYSAAAGYDLVTGLGVPNWGALTPLLTSRGSNGQPSFSLAAATKTRTPAVAITDPNAVAGQSTYKALDGTGSDCTTGMSTTVPTSVTLSSDQGAHTVSVYVLDPAGTCHVLTHTTVLDTVAPTTTLSVTYTPTNAATYLVKRTSTDASPSSGFKSYTLALTDLSANTTSTSTTTSASSTLKVAAGHSYRLVVTSSDAAGNTSAAVTSTFRAPVDDRAFTLKSTWVKQTNSSAYESTQEASGKAGATAQYAFVGKIATVRFTRTVSSGYADLYLDGKKIKRVDLYNGSTSFHYPVNVVASTTARHIISVHVVGAHRAGAKGSNVLLDALSWT